MPVFTLTQALDEFDGLVEPGGSLTRAINEVSERLFSMGTWRDQTFAGYYSDVARSGKFTLPPEAESVLAVATENRKVPVRDLWFIYVATYGRLPEYVGSGLVDLGYEPSMTDIDPENPITSMLVYTDNGDEYVPPSPGPVSTIEVTGEDTDGNVVRSTNSTTAGGGLRLNFATGLVQVTSIVYYHEGPGFLVVKDQASEALIAKILPGTGVCRFRKYAIGGLGDNAVVSVLLKRACTKLVDGRDILFVPTIAAFKHGLLGRIAENNSDLERSAYHWKEAKTICEEDLLASRGSARPVLQVQPFGEGIPAIINTP